MATPSPQRSFSSPPALARWAVAMKWLLWVAMILAVGGYRLRFGDVMVTDEGFYLGAAHRFALGDLPFRHEWDVSLRWFFVVLTPLMKLLPGGGTVLGLHWAGFLIHTASVGFLCWAVRRLLPGAWLALVFGLGALSVFNDWWVPNYYVLPFDFAMLSLGLWWLGLEEKKPLATAWSLGILSGLCLSLSIVTYWPRLPLLLLPLLVAAWGARHQGVKGTLTQTSTAVFVGGMMGLGVAVGWLCLSGLWGDWLGAVQAMREMKAYDVSPGYKLGKLLEQFLDTALVNAALMGLLWWLPVVAARRAGWESWRARLWGVLVVLLVLVYAALLFHWNLSRLDAPGKVMKKVFLGLMFMPLLAAVFRARAIQGFSETQKLCLALLFLTGYGGLAVAGATSTVYFMSAISGLTPLLLLGGVVLSPGGEPGVAAPPHRGLRGVVITLGLVSLLVVMVFNRDRNQDIQILGKPAIYESGKLRGMATNTLQHHPAQALLDYLQPRLKKGEFLLGYDRLAALYFLTNTRPALPVTFLNKYGWGPDQQRQMLRWMARHHRTPRYVVQYVGPDDGIPNLTYSSNPQVDPLHAWVLHHYRLVKTFDGPLECFGWIPERHQNNGVDYCSVDSEHTPYFRVYRHRNLQ